MDALSSFVLGAAAVSVVFALPILALWLRSWRRQFGAWVPPRRISHPRA